MAYSAAASTCFFDVATINAECTFIWTTFAIASYMVFVLFTHAACLYHTILDIRIFGYQFLIWFELCFRGLLLRRHGHLHHSRRLRHQLGLQPHRLQLRLQDRKTTLCLAHDITTTDSTSNTPFRISSRPTSLLYSISSTSVPAAAPTPFEHLFGQPSYKFTAFGTDLATDDCFSTSIDASYYFLYDLYPNADPDGGNECLLLQTFLLQRMLRWHVVLLHALSFTDALCFTASMFTLFHCVNVSHYFTTSYVSLRAMIQIRGFWGDGHHSHQVGIHVEVGEIGTLKTWRTWPFHPVCKAWRLVLRLTGT